jgi:micrococcal nuclease
MERKDALAAGLGASVIVLLLWGGGLAKIPDSSVKLERVVDGDTAYVLYKHTAPVHTKLRFLRINTPERGKRYYKEATDALKKLLKGKKLHLEFEKKGAYRTDRYGRALVYVFADGENVNIEMVRLGWSKHYIKYGTGKYKEKFKAAETEAREAGRGLWN